ncbi:hypothetical protein LCGC14_1905390 [marine sediment metagenome]|uniref:Uncharacterized protein n=1 Tax=marine sediment metagenome TaxID=412755 RepID=A0A0F9ITG5_9ZZZZ
MSHLDKAFDKFWKSKSLSVGMGNIATTPTEEDILSFIRQREKELLKEVINKLRSNNLERFLKELSNE